MTLRSDGRRVVQATMHPELYERLYAHCKDFDIPITVFIRYAIEAALPPTGDAEPASTALLRADAPLRRHHLRSSAIEFPLGFSTKP
jgi:predicted DNA-binding protein